MTNGTAKISFNGKLWIVRWTNIGSDLRNAPRAFHTANEAVAFCDALGLRAIG